MSEVWTGQRELVLGSTSPIRAQMLRAVGLPIRVLGSTVDEVIVRDALLASGESARSVAKVLAADKARDVSLRAADAFTIAFDQTLEFEGGCFGKPADSAELASRLCAFSGKTHHLHSAYAVARSGQLIAEGVETGSLHMRELSESFIAAYLMTVGEDALGSAGGYHIEGLGLHLFERMDGDLFTVMGAPMIQVLATLRSLGLVRS